MVKIPHTLKNTLLVKTVGSTLGAMVLSEEMLNTILPLPL